MAPEPQGPTWDPHLPAGTPATDLGLDGETTRRTGNEREGESAAKSLRKTERKREVLSGRENRIEKDRQRKRVRERARLEATRGRMCLG